MLPLIYKRKDQSEEFYFFGMVHDILFVVYTERKERIRMISARISSSEERRIYYDYNS